MLDRTTSPQVEIYENLIKIAKQGNRQAVIEAIEIEIGKLTGSLFNLEPDQPPVDLAAKFEEFWKVRPRRKGDDPKAPASKLFMMFCRRGANPDDIIEGARLCAASNDPKYTPQMTRWLRENRWKDYVKTTAAARKLDPAEAKRQQVLAEMRGHFG